MKFDVLRRHIGDKLYEQGDQREVEERDVAHLIKNGVLRPLMRAAVKEVAVKAEANAENKAEKAAPKNKAVG
ncbi:hypothetical protein QEZ48_14660 [Aquamicrobium lusatiense]|uniref:hypothetical protein n=1 Tax=Aquamicrobium lusatiense TaxID=89772 RepID=UPI00245697E5|nr:hypothetical protein [Aquamicrobium lusatiense]MDH4992059.1 hypothetical protein [Aquamicrobium lusatiense]